MANLNYIVLRSLTGYGNAGDVINIPETTQTDYLVTVGILAVYSGPVVPTVLPIILYRNFQQIATATTLVLVSGLDLVVELTAAPAVPTLPTAVGFNGTILTIKNRSGSSITPVTFGGQTIDGSAPVALTTNSILRLISDNANWLTI